MLKVLCFQIINHPDEYESSSSNHESEEEGSQDSGISDDNKPSDTQKLFTKGKGKSKRLLSKSRTTPYSRQALKCARSSDSQDITDIHQTLPEESIIRNPDVNYLDLLKKLQSYVASIVSLELYKDFPCYSDALRLANVTIVMTKSLQLGKLLMMFAHSVSCDKKVCTTSCRMFKRVRSHVSCADHSCAMMHVYGQLLRMHVDTCQEPSGKCGMTSCKSMRDMRAAQGNRVLPADFLTKEKVIAQVLKQQCKTDNGLEGEAFLSQDEMIIKEEPIDLQEQISEAALNLSTKSAQGRPDADGKKNRCSGR